MALLEFGSAEGLAYEHNFQQDTQNMFEQERLNRTARQDAENRAKLFGDMFQFGEATTTYNKQKLKEFSEGQIKDIGAYINANPDWQTNGGKYANVKNMSHKLLDNDWVKNDMAAVGEYQNLVKFIHDNPGAEQLPEVQQQLSKWDNYRKTGDDQGRVDLPETSKQRFMFNNPASTFDAHKAAEEQFGKLTYDDINPLHGNVRDGQVMEVSKAAKLRAAQTALTGYTGLKWKAAWNTLSPTEKQMYSTSDAKDGDIREWVIDMGRDYVPARKIQPAVNNPKYDTSSLSGTHPEVANYDKMIQATQAVPNIPHPVSSKVLGEVFRDDDGLMDLSDADLLKNRTIPGTGKQIPLNGKLGMVRANPTGIVTTIKDPTNSADPGTTVMEVEASMPFKDFWNKMKNVQLRDDGTTVEKAIDFQGWAGGLGQEMKSVNNDADFDFHQEYNNNTFRRVEPGEEDNKSKFPVVKFKMYKPIPVGGGNTDAIRGNYNHAMHVANTKAGDLDTADEIGNRQIETLLAKDETGNFWEVDQKGTPIASADISNYIQNPDGSFTKKK